MKETDGKSPESSPTRSRVLLMAQGYVGLPVATRAATPAYPAVTPS